MNRGQGDRLAHGGKDRPMLSEQRRQSILG
ncbi:DeoR family transcriptional regulator, partial [Mesorhizobium sp. M7A.F.Ca.CA.001.12.2.1]